MKSFILIACLLFSTPVLTAPALVKSGEHESYSRLVVYTGKTQTWQKTQDGSKISVLVEGWSSGFDISEVFDLIPRDRIANLNQNTSRLDLTLACNCDVIVAPVDQGGIMIDVRDRLTPPPTGPDPVLPTRSKSNAQNFTFPKKNTVSVTALRKRLTESVGKAATQELLTAIPPKDISEQLTNRDERGHVTAPSPKGRIRSTSASERAAQSKQPTLPNEACPPYQFGDIENWGTDAPFSSQISELRKALVGEFDITDREVALQLVQLYVFFGMGAEAISTSQSLNLTGPEAGFLLPLAQLVDSEPAPKPLDLKMPTNGCTGSLAIWAALLAKQSETVSNAQAKVISEAFSHLPHHLKSILGPPIMSRLKRDANDVAASVIQNSISSSTDEEISFATLEGLSVPELENLIAKGDAQTPLAIVALLEIYVSKNEAVNESIRDIATSFKVQQHGETVALEIGKLLTMDTANRGEFLAAMDMALTELIEPDRGEAISYISDLLVKKGNDMTVAKFALRLQNSSNFGTLEDKTMEVMSQRLRQMGMLELAASAANQPIASTASVSTEQLDDTQVPEGSIQKPETSTIIPSLLGATSVMEDSQRIREQITNLLTPENLTESN